MKQIKSAITIPELNLMAQRMYGNLVKGVVDIKNKELVLDAEMHVDEEQFLLEKGSNQADLWGINLYPANYGKDDFVEFDSMINIRPSANNFSRGIENQNIKEAIKNIIYSKVTGGEL